MDRPLKLDGVANRKAFFGEWPPIVGPLLTLVLGLVALTTFYASVFAAAHVVTASNGGGRDELQIVSLWMCALFLIQGLVPLVRFGTNDLPRLVAHGARLRATDVAMFVLLLAFGLFLLFG